ncbi:MAG: hypothetical protein K2L27_00085 [Muribaculaceae bacterium]|nr:hypothetical protein [Muribaculaceae bacterium]
MHDSDRLARLLAAAFVAAVGLAVLSLGVSRMMRPRADHADPDRARYPMRGIDISAHNGLVDFRRVAADSVAFVFLKASEGDSFRDATFDDNYFRARQAGLAVGAYHFFRFDCEGWRQGDNMLRALAGKPVDLPLAIDIEEAHNAAAVPTGEIVVQLHGMIDYLRGQGYDVVLYTNKSGHHRFVRGRFSDMPLWISSFTNPPISRADWLFWQHSHSGRVRGVAGHVDLNTFCGDSAAFRELVTRSQATGGER